MVITRRRDYRVVGKRKEGFRKSLLDDSGSESSAENLSWSNAEDEGILLDYSPYKQLPKRRKCCGIAVYTPNTSRFSDHLHSRVLQKFPFLIEMFYWIITYFFYRMSKIVSNIIFSETIIDVAEGYGLAVLEFEQFSWLSFLFPYKELDVQHWFMDRHQSALTVINRAYALIHIPGTVGYVILSGN